MALYNAFIFPRLNYGIEAYTNAKGDCLKKLITSQNKILRILQFKPYTSDTNNLYSKFSVLKLEDMLKINLCSLTHNLIYSTYKVPFAIQGLFIRHKDVQSYDTRNKNDIHFNHMSTITYGKKTISYKAGTYWNNLTSDLKHVKSLKNFKKLLKKQTISTYNCHCSSF